MGRQPRRNVLCPPAPRDGGGIVEPGRRRGSSASRRNGRPEPCLLWPALACFGRRRAPLSRGVRNLTLSRETLGHLLALRFGCNRRQVVKAPFYGQGPSAWGGPATKLGLMARLSQLWGAGC